MNASEWTSRVRSYYRQEPGSPGVYRRKGYAPLAARRLFSGALLQAKGAPDDPADNFIFRSFSGSQFP